MIKDAVILIVDDQPTNLEVLSESLGIKGWEVLVAVNGEEALEQAEYAQPDLILLDVMMPGIDGFETCLRLKSQPNTCEIPVIFMTALADVENKIKGLQLGAVDYITKPFNQVEVLARVEIHLRLRKMTETLAQQNHKLKKFNEDLEEKVAERTQSLSESLASLKKAQLQLVQQEKMASLGQLLSGIAHEINNPLGFILGNLEHTEYLTQTLLKTIELYQRKFPDVDAELSEYLEEIELDFLKSDFPKLISSMKSGTERIKQISSSLRNFTRNDNSEKSAGNLHSFLDGTLMILSYRLKGNQNRPAIQVEKNYGNLPLVECYAGEINQVFMNILANAIDALDESNEGQSFATISEHPNQIVITTEVSPDQKWVWLRIRDNGKGISASVKEKIFDYLFTTKPINKGTGLGLSISYDIIVHKHQGSLTCESELGKGTEFTIALPINAC